MPYLCIIELSLHTLLPHFFFRNVKMSLYRTNSSEGFFFRSFVRSLNNGYNLRVGYTNRANISTHKNNCNHEKLCSMELEILYIFFLIWLQYWFREGYLQRERVTKKNNVNGKNCKLGSSWKFDLNEMHFRQLKRNSLCNFYSVWCAQVVLPIFFIWGGDNNPAT